MFADVTIEPIPRLTFHILEKLALPRAERTGEVFVDRAPACYDCHRSDAAAGALTPYMGRLLCGACRTIERLRAR